MLINSTKTFCDGAMLKNVVSFLGDGPRFNYLDTASSSVSWRSSNVLPGSQTDGKLDQIMWVMPDTQRIMKPRCVNFCIMLSGAQHIMSRELRAYE